MAYPYYPTYGNWNMNNPVQPFTSQAAQNDIVWVQGEADAKARPVIAGHSALFMDSEDTCFYIKTVDNSGIPQPLRIFDYKERTQAQTPKKEPVKDTVTRAEFEDLVKKVDGIIQGEGEG